MKSLSVVLGVLALTFATLAQEVRVADLGQFDYQAETVKSEPFIGTKRRGLRFDAAGNLLVWFTYRSQPVLLNRPPSNPKRQNLVRILEFDNNLKLLASNDLDGLGSSTSELFTTSQFTALQAANTISVLSPELKPVRKIDLSSDPLQKYEYWEVKQTPDPSELCVLYRTLSDSPDRMFIVKLADLQKIEQKRSISKSPATCSTDLVAFTDTWRATLTIADKRGVIIHGDPAFRGSLALEWLNPDALLVCTSSGPRVFDLSGKLTASHSWKIENGTIQKMFSPTVSLEGRYIAYLHLVAKSRTFDLGTKIRSLEAEVFDVKRGILAASIALEPAVDSEIALAPNGELLAIRQGLQLKLLKLQLPK